MRVIEIGSSRKRTIILSVVHRIVLKNSVESCGSDEALPLIAGLLLESFNIHYSMVHTHNAIAELHCELHMMRKVVKTAC